MVRVPSGREAERQPVRLLCSVHTAGRMRDGEEQSEEEPTLGRRSGGKGRHPRHRQDRGRAKTRAGQKQGIDTGRAEAGHRHGQGRGRAKTQAGQRQGEERGFHLENLFLHLLQPPQHPREGQRSRAGGRQAGEVFWPTQLQVRLGSGSPGPGWTLTTSRHLLYLSEHVSCHNHGGELGEMENQASFPRKALSWTPPTTH